MKDVQWRGGQALLWRLGNLTYGEQSAWDRAPMKRGMWAFPWPWYDESFTRHQYDYVMPKRLQGNEWGEPLSAEWYRMDDGSIPLRVELDRANQQMVFDGTPSWDYDVDRSFYEARRQWVRDVGRRTLPLRKFWYDGEVYTHLTRAGLPLEDGTLDCDGIERWHRVPIDEAVRRMKKARGQFDLLASTRRGYRYVGMLELFLPPRAGRIS